MNDVDVDGVALALDELMKAEVPNLGGEKFVYG